MVTQILASAVFAPLLLELYPAPLGFAADLPAEYITMYWHRGKIGDGAKSVRRKINILYMGGGCGCDIQRNLGPYD